MAWLRTSSPSLPGLHGSVHVASTAPAWRRALAFAGPGFLVAVGYVDPGNWATSLAGGSAFGYIHLFVILTSSLIAMYLQGLCCRLGLATGRDLAQACRDAYPRPVALLLWLSAEAAIAATDLAEVIGSAVALKLLFGLPTAAGVWVTAADVLLLFAVAGSRVRVLEGVVGLLMLLIAGCFAAELAYARPDGASVAWGFLPSRRLFADSDALLVAVGILGATVMPHNLYLHSALVQTRTLTAATDSDATLDGGAGAPGLAASSNGGDTDGAARAGGADGSSPPVRDAKSLTSDGQGHATGVAPLHGSGGCSTDQQSLAHRHAHPAGSDAAAGTGHARVEADGVVTVDSDGDIEMTRLQPKSTTSVPKVSPAGDASQSPAAGGRDGLEDDEEAALRQSLSEGRYRLASPPSPPLVPDTPAETARKRTSIRYAIMDSTACLCAALFVNAAILITSAAAFHDQGHEDVATLEEAHALLAPALGSGAAAVLFAVALLAAGQNSTVTGTLAGQIVMEGFVSWRVSPVLRRLVTRLCAIIPASLAAGLAGDAGVNRALIVSQVVLAFQLPFAVFPLVAFTADRAKMGPHAVSRPAAAAGWAIAAFILALNLWLLSHVLGGS